MSVFGDNSMFNILAGVLAVVIVLIICCVVIVCYYLSKHRDLKGGHQDLIPPIRGSFMNLQEVAEAEADNPTIPRTRPAGKPTSPKKVARMGINTPMIKSQKGNLHHISTSSPQAPLTPCQPSPHLQNPHQLSPALSQLRYQQSHDQGSYLQSPQQDSYLQPRQPSTPQYLQPEVQSLQQSPRQEVHSLQQSPQTSVQQGVQSPQQEVQSPQQEVQYPQQSPSLFPQIHQQSPVQLDQPAHQSQTPRCLLSSVQSPLNFSYQPRRMDVESPYTPVYVDL